MSRKRVHQKNGGKIDMDELPDQIYKKQLTEIMTTKTGATLQESKDAYDALVESILPLLIHGKSVTLKNLGTFSIVEHDNRTVRNPKTGEHIELPKDYSISFRRSANFRKIIKEYLNEENSDESSDENLE